MRGDMNRGRETLSEMIAMEDQALLSVKSPGSAIRIFEEEISSTHLFRRRESIQRVNR